MGKHEAPDRRRNRRPVDAEAQLDEAIRELLGKGEADYSPRDWRGLREELRLTLLYPGRFVAFRDHHRGEGERRRLVCREVLHSSRSLASLQRRLAQLPEHERRDVSLSYVEPGQAPRHGR